MFDRELEDLLRQVSRFIVATDPPTIQLATPRGIRYIVLTGPDTEGYEENEKYMCVKGKQQQATDEDVYYVALKFEKHQKNLERIYNALKNSSAGDEGVQRVIGHEDYCIVVEWKGLPFHNIMRKRPLMARLRLFKRILILFTRVYPWEVATILLDEHDTPSASLTGERLADGEAQVQLLVDILYWIMMEEKLIRNQDYESLVLPDVGRFMNELISNPDLSMAIINANFDEILERLTLGQTDILAKLAHRINPSEENLIMSSAYGALSNTAAVALATNPMDQDKTVVILPTGTKRTIDGHYHTPLKLLLDHLRLSKLVKLQIVHELIRSCATTDLHIKGSNDLDGYLVRHPFTEDMSIVNIEETRYSITARELAELVLFYRQPANVGPDETIDLQDILERTFNVRHKDAALKCLDVIIDTVAKQQELVTFETSKHYNE